VHRVLKRPGFKLPEHPRGLWCKLLFGRMDPELFRRPGFKFRLSRNRDVAAAKTFFKKAIRHEGRPPHTIPLDGYAASHRAVREMQEDGLLPRHTKLRAFKHLNNLRAGSSWHQEPNPAGAWLQDFCVGCHYDRRYRTAPSYLQRPIRPGPAAVEREGCKCGLECCTRGISAGA
jgi:hypothetical protein